VASGGDKMRKIKSESSGTSSWLRKMKSLSSSSKSRKSLPNTPTDSTITNPATGSSSTDMARLKLNFGHEQSTNTLTYHHVTPCNCKLSYCTTCSRNSVCRSILSHESHHTRTSLGYQDHLYHQQQQHHHHQHQAMPPPKLQNMIKEPKSLYRTNSARVPPNPPVYSQHPRRESLGGGFGTNGSGRSLRLSSSNRTKQQVTRCLNPDGAGEMKRNEQIKARNCYLLEKNAESLSENEKIIRRSLEKVDSWLRELPATFPPIHDVMTPYNLIENRV